MGIPLLCNYLIDFLLPSTREFSSKVSAYRDVFHKNRDNPKWKGAQPESYPCLPEGALGAFEGRPRSRIFTMEQRCC